MIYLKVLQTAEPGLIETEEAEDSTRQKTMGKPGKTGESWGISLEIMGDAPSCVGFSYINIYVYMYI